MGATRVGSGAVTGELPVLVVGMSLGSYRSWKWGCHWGATGVGSGDVTGELTVLVVGMSLGSY